MKDSSVISEFLESGERVLWIGRPVMGFALSPSERGYLVTMLAMLGVFAWFAWRIFHGGPLGANAVNLGWFVIMAVSPLAILWFAGRPLFRSLSRRRRMVYCLTDRRALIVEASKRKIWAWLRIDYDTPIAVTEASVRRGHISFGRRYDFDTEEWPLFRGFTFYNITGVGAVVDQVVALQKRLAPSGVDAGGRRSAATVAVAKTAPVGAGMKLYSL